MIYTICILLEQSQELAYKAKTKLSQSTTKPTKWCVLSKDSAQLRHPPSPIGLHCLHEEIFVLATQWAHSEDRLDMADAQADLEICWVHRSICCSGSVYIIP